jgi:hypothetical protein
MLPRAHTRNRSIGMIGPGVRRALTFTTEHEDAAVTEEFSERRVARSFGDTGARGAFSAGSSPRTVSRRLEI